MSLEDLEREYQQLCGEEQVALARKERARQDVLTLRAEVASVTQSIERQQENSRRTAVASASLSDTIRTLEAVKESQRKRGTELQHFLLSLQRNLVQFERDHNELQCFMHDGVPAMLMREMAVFKPEQDEYLSQLMQREAEKSRLKRQRLKQTENWSENRTTGSGDQSASRLAEADEELMLQKAEQDMGMLDWDQLSLD